MEKNGGYQISGSKRVDGAAWRSNGRVPGSGGMGKRSFPRFSEEGHARETQAQLFSLASVVSVQEEYR